LKNRLPTMADGECGATRKRGMAYYNGQEDYILPLSVVNTRDSVVLITGRTHFCSLWEAKPTTD